MCRLDRKQAKILRRRSQTDRERESKTGRDGLFKNRVTTHFRLRFSKLLHVHTHTLNTKNNGAVNPSKQDKCFIIQLTTLSVLQSASERAGELAQFELFCHLPRICRQCQICFPKSGGAKPTWQLYHRPPGGESDGFSRCSPGRTNPTF